MTNARQPALTPRPRPARAQPSSVLSDATVGELQRAAHAYVARGLAVLPLLPADKRPHGRLVRHGVNQATTEPAAVHAWWTAAPDANVAIGCGHGLAVLDVDPRNGGDATLAAQLETAGEPLPGCPEVHTGGGGRHYYFAAAPDTRSVLLGPGLELKAAGGYVVAPPSRHPSGRTYAWHPARTLDDFPALPALPAWARPADGNGMCAAGSSADERALWALRGAREGERRRAALALAGHLLARGVDPAVTIGLLEAWRRTRTEAGTNPFPAGEIVAIVSDLVRRQAAKRQTTSTISRQR